MSAVVRVVVVDVVFDMYAGRSECGSVRWVVRTPVGSSVGSPDGGSVGPSVCGGHRLRSGLLSMAYLSAPLLPLLLCV